MTVEIPPGLDWMRADPIAAAWLAELPAVVQRCAALWGLALGPPYGGSHVSWVAPTTAPDGTPAVLKIQLPDRESRHEADALARWDGDGAVRLLASHDEDHAMLIE